MAGGSYGAPFIKKQINTMSQIIVDRLKSAIENQESAAIAYQEIETMLLAKFPYEELLKKTARVRSLQRVYFNGGVVNNNNYLPRDYRVLGMSKTAEQDLDLFLEKLK